MDGVLRIGAALRSCGFPVRDFTVDVRDGVPYSSVTCTVSLTRARPRPSPTAWRRWTASSRSNPADQPACGHLTVRPDREVVRPAQVVAGTVGGSIDGR